MLIEGSSLSTSLGYLVKASNANRNCGRNFTQNLLGWLRYLLANPGPFANG